jgi:DNA-3-methyladenine glycosylase
VLIRALDPLDGVPLMRRRRARAAKGRRPAVRGLADHDLCRGPGNLTLAMGITLEENRADLLGRRLYIEDRGVLVAPGTIEWGPRIGISVATEHPWRAWVGGHPAVSAPARAARRRGYSAAVRSASRT